MTRARTLKSTIRARMTKTGERYTTARRHVLAASARGPAVASSAAASAPARAVSADRRGAVSDAKVLERTGHDLAHWFAILDRFGAVEKGHTAAARHLREALGVDSWYSQGITVAYERARGLRTVNQRSSGTFEGSVSKTVTALPIAVERAFRSPRGRARWASALDHDLAHLLAAATKGKAPAGFITRPSGERRCRHRWEGGAFELLLTPRPDGRTTVLVLHSRVPTRAALDHYRRQWRAALAVLATALAPGRLAGRPRVRT